MSVVSIIGGGIIHDPSTCIVTPKLSKTFRNTCFHTRYVEVVSLKGTRVLMLIIGKDNIEKDMFATKKRKFHHQKRRKNVKDYQLKILDEKEKDQTPLSKKKNKWHERHNTENTGNNRIGQAIPRATPEEQRGIIERLKLPEH